MELQKVPGRQAWHVVAEDGATIGRIDEVHLGRARSTFWHAYAFHLSLDRMVSIEASADREERLRCIAQFRDDPNAFAQHWR